MAKNVWKIIAIISIIVAVIELIMLIYLFSAGGKMIENENECAYNTCEGYDAYLYDSVEGLCYCYTDGEIVKTQYLG